MAIKNLVVRNQMGQADGDIEFIITHGLGIGAASSGGLFVGVATQWVTPIQTAGTGWWCMPVRVAPPYVTGV